jgi:acyl carrier protein
MRGCAGRFDAGRSRSATKGLAVADPLLEVFAEGLGLSAETLGEDSSPDTVAEWDSLAAMTLVTLIEDTFAVSLSTRDIMKMRSIGLARSVLKAKGVAGI